MTNFDIRRAISARLYRGKHHISFNVCESHATLSRERGTAWGFWERGQWWILFRLDQRGAKTQRVNPAWFLRNILGDNLNELEATLGD